MKKLLFALMMAIIALSGCGSNNVEFSGKMNKWHKMTMIVPGPNLSETDSDNPFLDYRLNVTFINGDKKYVVPGFYAADGNAAETNATDGNKWLVRFRPDEVGQWSYEISFRKGKYIAVSDSVDFGEPVSMDGSTGIFSVSPADENGPFAKGKLQYVGERYLKFAETGEYYLKAGADSPENFLAFNEFDGTRYAGDGSRRIGEAGPNENLHTYSPHAQDFKDGDPTWQNGKGKNMIGALNYLASKGMNTVYFLTMNYHGDGNDVWPWIDPFERTRFDCSKLDQWEIVFDHMDKLGIMLHVVTQETENELVLDNGFTGTLRKLYYRELIARFGHHLAVTWNLGEENGFAEFTPNAQNDQMRKDMAEYIKTLDPYKNFISLHTHAGKKHRDEILEKIVGFEYLDGPSLQIDSPERVHKSTVQWLNESEKTGKQWVAFLDEIGPYHTGVKPDADDPDHDYIRTNALWGNLMAGGGGAEWYFGYKFAHSDLGCEDWRSRDNMWEQSKIAIDFFHTHLPFQDMKSADNLLSGKANWCLAKPGEIYAIYFPKGGSTRIKLESGQYSIQWFNPKTGGELQSGSIQKISGPGMKSVGNPPTNFSEDWVALLKSL